MATLSTLGQLMFALPPQMPQYDPIQVARQQQALQGDRTGNATALLQLEELRRQQETAARTRQYYQEHPEALLGGQPTSTLGALQAAPPGGGAPPPGAITQQAFGPGGVGEAQTIPAPMQQGANLGGPPGGMPGGTSTSTLASIGPQPQAPRHPLMDLVRQNPDAAMAVLNQQTKLQEQQFKMRSTVAEAIASELQGATDQASYDLARQRVAQISPQWAQALPPFYSKEGVQPFIDRALSAKERMVLQTNAGAAQAELLKARMSGRVAKTDQYLKALGVAPGQETAEDMQKALAWQQRDEMTVSASHGTGQIVQAEPGVFVRIKPGTNEVEEIKGPGGQPLRTKPTQAETETATYGNLARQGHTGAVELENKGFTPGFWAKTADQLPLHMGNYLTSDDYQKYKDYVMDFAQAWLRRTSKGAITETEWKFVDERYFPQPGNSKAQIEQKRAAREAVIKELEAEGKATGRTGGQGQPTSQAPSGSQTSQAPAGGKVVSRAALHAEAQRRGVSPEQAEQLARQKGYTVQ